MPTQNHQPKRSTLKLKKIALGGLLALAVAGTAGWLSLDKETRGLLKTVPTNRDLLFWTVPQRDAAFRALDRIPLLAKWHVIPASTAPTTLPPGPPLRSTRPAGGWGRAGRRPAPEGGRPGEPGDADHPDPLHGDRTDGRQQIEIGALMEG